MECVTDTFWTLFCLPLFLLSVSMLLIKLELIFQWGKLYYRIKLLDSFIGAIWAKGNYKNEWILKFCHQSSCPPGCPSFYLSIPPSLPLQCFLLWSMLPGSEGEKYIGREGAHVYWAFLCSKARGWMLSIYSYWIFAAAARETLLTTC